MHPKIDAQIYVGKNIIFHENPSKTHPKNDAEINIILQKRHVY